MFEIVWEVGWILYGFHQAWSTLGVFPGWHKFLHICQSPLVWSLCQHSVNKMCHCFSYTASSLDISYNESTLASITSRSFWSNPSGEYFKSKSPVWLDQQTDIACLFVFACTLWAEPLPLGEGFRLDPKHNMPGKRGCFSSDKWFQRHCEGNREQGELSVCR